MVAITRSRWVTGQVLKQHQWTTRLFSLQIEVALDSFKAGQFIRLQLPVEDNGEFKLIAKSYSLVNAPHNPVAEIFYNIVPNGKLSNALAQLQEGDAIEVSQPANGFFVLDEIPDARHLWMIATGTGLGPYLSILQDKAVWQRFERIILVHSVPLIAELAYRALLDNLAQQHPAQFKWIGCVTRESYSQGLSQRVTTTLQNGVLEQMAGVDISPDDSHVMLCGNHQMLDEMKGLLANRGLQRHLRHKPGHITTEQYF